MKQTPRLYVVAIVAPADLVKLRVWPKAWSSGQVAYVELVVKQ